MKKRILTLTSVGLLAVLPILGLYLYSQQRDRAKSIQSRNLLPHALYNPKEIDLGINSFYLAGFDNDSVYLGNVSAPTLLLAICKTTKDTVYSNIRVTDTLWGKPGIFVSADSVTMVQRSPAVIWTGKKGEYLTKVNAPGLSILTYQLLQPGRIVSRVYDPDEGKQYLMKPSGANDGTRLHLSDSLGSVLTHDGMISYHIGSGMLAYVFYYQNIFVITDTNLNNIVKGTTFGTDKLTAGSVGKVFNETALSFANAPAFVNRLCFNSDEKLFIQSEVCSQSETPGDFEDICAIDAYDLKSAHYKFSFYLPKYRGLKVTDAKWHDNVIYALYGRYLLSFRTAFDKFKR